MSGYPEDVYLEILARLPVKSTYVCKCVCKSWFQIISNPNFDQMHLNHANQRNKTNLLVKSHDKRRGQYGKDVMYSISYDSLSLSEIQGNNFVEIADYPFKITDHSDELVDSCNGLVCIYSYPRDFFGVWNPATKEYKIIIPNSTNKYGSGSGFKCMLGFGYDHKADDYKIISIESEVDGLKDSSLVEVYTLRSNSWKNCRTVRYMLPYGEQVSGLLVNGALHWFVQMRNKNSLLIVSFDISNENFNELQQPKELLDSDQQRIIGVLDGYLSVLVKVVRGCFEVWVMQDYGVQESWTKRYIIYDAEIINSYIYFKPMWCYYTEMGGEILLHTDFSLELYDPKHGRTKELDMFRIMFWNQVNYFESLVSPNSGTYVE